MGRKPVYRKEYHDPWAWSLASRGCTDIEIAEAMGVSRKTISEWKYITHADGTRVLSSFGEALANAKEAIDSQVENALFKRACGFSVSEREQYTEDGKRKVRLKERHFPPEVRAAEMWLYNRQSGRWKSPRSTVVNVIAGSITAEAETVIAQIFSQAREESGLIAPAIIDPQIEYTDEDDNGQ